MDIHIENVPHVVIACCVLHNFCEIHGDSFNEEWLQDNDLDDSVESNLPHDDHNYSSSSSSCEGVATRNTLVEYLSS